MEDQGKRIKQFFKKESERMQTLQELVEQLPPDLREEARKFIEFLLQKYENKPRGTPRFDWSGSLKDLKSQYTSVQLQHKISEWRIGER